MRDRDNFHRQQKCHKFINMITNSSTDCHKIHLDGYENIKNLLFNLQNDMMLV